MNKKAALKALGLLCSTYRKSMHISQSTIAIKTGYTVENISAFERGRNCNFIIFLAYVNIIPIPDIIKELNKIWRIYTDEYS